MTRTDAILQAITQAVTSLRPVLDRNGLSGVQIRVVLSAATSEVKDVIVTPDLRRSATP